MKQNKSNNVEAYIELSPDIIKNRFIEFNKKYFKNILDTNSIAFRLSKMSQLAHTRAKRRREYDENYIEKINYKTVAISFNKDLKFTQKEFDLILLHEMVHAKLFDINNLNCGHNSLFIDECWKISSKHKLEQFHLRSTEIQFKKIVETHIFKIKHHSGIEAVVLCLNNKSRVEKVTKRILNLNMPILETKVVKDLSIQKYKYSCHNIISYDIASSYF